MNIKSIKTIFLCLFLLAGNTSIVQADKLDDYISSFTYQERKDMKISSAELVNLPATPKVVSP